MTLNSDLYNFVVFSFLVYFPTWEFPHDTNYKFKSYDIYVKSHRVEHHIKKNYLDDKN